MALSVVVALPVDAFAQARLGEDFLVELALFAQFHLRFVGVDELAPFVRDLIF